jgi:hypothetical protein
MDMQDRNSWAGHRKESGVFRYLVAFEYYAGAILARDVTSDATLNVGSEASGEAITRKVTCTRRIYQLQFTASRPL